MLSLERLGKGEISANRAVLGEKFPEFPANKHLRSTNHRIDPIMSQSQPDPNLLPDFLVIGAGKSGTTSLNEYLRQHPEVYMTRKEPNFFAFEMYSPEDFDDPVDREYYFQAAYNLELYQELFQAARPGQLKGEVSNTYMTHPPAYDRIKYYVPQVKLIAILRHPADRLFSRFAHREREGMTENLALEDIFDRDSYWWQSPDLVPEGFYYKQLKPYFERFSPDQLRIYLYEEFTEDTDRVFSEILDYLGLSQEVEIDTGVVYNKTGKVKNSLLHKLIGPNSAPLRWAKSMVPQSIYKHSEGGRLRSWIHKIRSNNLEKTPIPQDLRDRVTREIYHEDISKLEQLIGKDLSTWFK